MPHEPSIAGSSSRKPPHADLAGLTNRDRPRAGVVGEYWSRASTRSDGACRCTPRQVSSTAICPPEHNESTSSIRPASPFGGPAARATCGCARRSRSDVASVSAEQCASPASSPPTHSVTAAIPIDWRLRCRTMLALASELEGHADNVAASLFGGIVATADGHAVRVPLAFDPAIVVWIPSFTTSTDESRSKLGGDVPLADAVFNIGRTALLVAALAAGDIESLRQRDPGPPAPGPPARLGRTVEGGPRRGARRRGLVLVVVGLGSDGGGDVPVRRCRRSGRADARWAATPRCCASITTVR